MSATIYEEVTRRFPVPRDYPVVIILDPDGHFATMPASKELLDDSGMDDVVAGELKHLLVLRRMSREKGVPYADD